MQVGLENLEIKYTPKKRRSRESIEAEIMEAFTTIFKEVPSINVIVMLGYTPGFNDGDLCVHSQCFAVQGYDGYEVYMRVFGEEFGDDEEETEYIQESFEKKHGFRLPTRTFWHLEEGASIEQQHWVRVGKLLYNMRQLFRDVYYTNWQLIITRTGEDKFNIEQDEYDCGH